MDISIVAELPWDESDWELLACSQSGVTVALQTNQNYIGYSLTGMSAWQVNESFAFSYFHHLAGANGVFFICGDHSVTTDVLRSVDGLAWAEVSGSLSGVNSVTNLVYDGQYYFQKYAVGLYRSLDTLAWEAVTEPIAGDFKLRAVNGTVLLFDNTSNQFYYSTDHGATWSATQVLPLHSEIDYSTLGICVDLTNNRFVFVALKGTTEIVTSISEDFISWETNVCTIPSTSRAIPFLVAASRAEILVATSSTSFFTDNNGQTYDITDLDAVSPYPDADVFNIVWNGNVFCLLSRYGTVFAVDGTGGISNFWTAFKGQVETA